MTKKEAQEICGNCGHEKEKHKGRYSDWDKEKGFPCKKFKPFIKEIKGVTKIKKIPNGFILIKKPQSPETKPRMTSKSVSLRANKREVSLDRNEDKTRDTQSQDNNLIRKRLESAEKSEIREGSLHPVPDALRGIFDTAGILNEVFKIYFKHPKTYNELHLIVKKAIELTTKRLKSEVEKAIDELIKEKYRNLPHKKVKTNSIATLEELKTRLGIK